MSLSYTWELHLHAIPSFSTITFPVPDYPDERELIRKMERHNPSASMNNRRCWLMLHFSLTPESLQTNVRFCGVVQCGYPKAVCGLATKACSHHKGDDPWVKFLSDVLQIEETLWPNRERNNWDVLNLLPSVFPSILTVVSCHFPNVSWTYWAYYEFRILNYLEWSTRSKDRRHW